MKDSSLMKKTDTDEKRVKELSAKEQESGRKFKEKFNKLKKMPMPPQPTINVNSEGLTEGELIIEKVKRKFKQVYNKYFKEPLPSVTTELEKSVGKNLESTFCKSVGGLPAQVINNEQMVLISKNKSKTQDIRATENNEQIELPPKTEQNLKALDKTEPVPQYATIPAKKIEEFMSATKSNEKSLDPDLFKPKIDVASQVVAQKPSASAIASDSASASTSTSASAKEDSLRQVFEPKKRKERKQPKIKVTNVRGGILSSILKNFAFVPKLFEPNSWFRFAHEKQNTHFH